MKSRLCTFADFQTPWFRDYLVKAQEGFSLHRKQWEDASIYEAIRRHFEHASSIRYGIGFGVGQELLPSLLASEGAYVLATDQELTEDSDVRWNPSGQLCTELQQLNQRGLCNQREFDKRVSFLNVDMNAIPEQLYGTANFVWSACALDHLGSIELGLGFIRNSVKCLKPGGIAVHTTEYNCSSNEDTIEEGSTVFFRKRDIERLGLEVDWTAFTHFVDRYIDEEPHQQEVHLKLRAGGYVVTSIVLILHV